MNDWEAALSMRDLAPADGCGVPPDFWLVSDTHFGHVEINGYTGRPGDAEERIVANWHSLVAENDVVVHLGDLTLMHPDCIAPLLSELPGRLLLLLGNHDRPEPETYDRLGIRIIPPFTLLHGGWTVAFTHAPHLELVAPPYSRHLNVHGHIHSPLAPDLRLINVCVEWTEYAPVRARELLDARIAALERAPAVFEPPLPYDAWLAREYSGPIQISDLTRFPDARARAVARGAYERYRYAVLAAALAGGRTASGDG